MVLSVPVGATYGKYMMFDKTPPITRMGKTAREHANGSWAHRQTNADARKAWNQAVNERGAKGKHPFPIEVCNGRESRALKRVHVCNRRAVTGKKGGGACKHRKGKKA